MVDRRLRRNTGAVEPQAERATIAQALVVAESLRRDGGMASLPLAAEIEEACRAALSDPERDPPDPGIAASSGRASPAPNGAFPARHFGTNVRTPSAPDAAAITHCSRTSFLPRMRILRLSTSMRSISDLRAGVSSRSRRSRISSCVRRALPLRRYGIRRAASIRSRSLAAHSPSWSAGRAWYFPSTGPWSPADRERPWKRCLGLDRDRMMPRVRSRFVLIAQTRVASQSRLSPKTSSRMSPI